LDGIQRKPIQKSVQKTNFSYSSKTESYPLPQDVSLSVTHEIADSMFPTAGMKQPVKIWCM